MDASTKKSIELCLTALQVDITKDLELARSFFILKLIHSMSGHDSPYHACLKNPQFTRHLKRHHIDYFIPFEEISEEHEMTIDLLCGLLVDNNLLDDYKSFFNSFSPFIVADWDAFISQFPDSEKYGTAIAALCYILMRAHPHHTVDITSVDWSNHCMHIPDIDDYWINTLKLPKESFARCWEAIFSFKSCNVPTQINGTIYNAIKKYRKYFVPLERLFEDYCVAKRIKKDNVINPWAYVHKGIDGIPVEISVSVDETLFELAAYTLKSEKPSDIIRSLFYPRSRNDSTFECSFLFSEFLKLSHNKNSVLIVHPNPDFIKAWAEKAISNGVKSTYIAVPNKLFSELYAEEFPSINFICFDAISTLNSIDCVLITSRNIPIEDISPLMSALAVCSPEATILALLPNALFDCGDSKPKLMMTDNNIRIDRIAIIDSSVIASSPRKKTLFYLYRTERLANLKPEFPAYYLTKGRDNNYYITKQYWLIELSTFLGIPLSIKTMFNLAVSGQSYISKFNKSCERLPANTYDFTRDIPIYYTISSDRKNRFAAKAYYCEIVTENAKRKRGKRLSEIIEKGLRGKTEHEVVKNLERIPFDERVSPYIISDVLSKHLHNMDSLTLKSIWFCNRPSLLNNKAYDDEIAINIFCGESQEFSDIIPRTSKLEDYTNAMEFIIGHESETTRYKYWKQIDLILKCGIVAGHLMNNPISQFVSDMSVRATDEQREVRNALVKKTFTSAEESDMLKYLSRPIKTVYNDTMKVKRYMGESIWLAGAIKLYTGMSTREVCALQWKDFVNIPGTDMYQLLVSKFINDKGSVEKHLTNSEKKKFRRVPVAPALSKMLNERRQFLSDSFPSAAERTVPIVLPKESATSANFHFCKPRQATKKIKEIVAAAKIPEEILMLPDGGKQTETDVNRYHGDIFLTNFKYRANHTCSLTRGEINYIMGLEPPDTFSRHYCDYTNDLLQYAMARKLNRWVINGTNSKPQQPVDLFARNTTHAVHFKDGNISAADVFLDNASSCPCSFDISVDCDHGFECNITFWGEEANQ